MAGKHRNLVHVGRLSQRREIPHLHVLNHALSKWCHHRKLLCEIEFAGISNSIVSERAFSAKKISDESEITEEWKEVSGRRTTSRSCYYRDSGLVQLPIMSTRRPRGGGFKALIFGQAAVFPTCRLILVAGVFRNLLRISQRRHGERVYAPIHHALLAHALLGDNTPARFQPN